MSTTENELFVFSLNVHSLTHATSSTAHNKTEHVNQTIVFVTFIASEALSFTTIYLLTGILTSCRLYRREKVRFRWLLENTGDFGDVSFSSSLLITISTFSLAFFVFLIVTIVFFTRHMKRFAT